MRKLLLIVMLLFAAGLLFLWFWGIPSPATNVVRSLPVDILISKR